MSSIIFLGGNIYSHIVKAKVLPNIIQLMSHENKNIAFPA
jgi:hypothetical protein